MIARTTPLLGAATLLVLMACERDTQGPPRTAESPPSLATAKAASAPAAPPATATTTPPTPSPSNDLAFDPATAKAWTDREAIAALAKDCKVVVSETEEGGLLQCGLKISEQSCVPDPCFDDGACKRTCGGTCATCTESCTQTCDSCKTKCQDDACRLACATSCGACRQDCLTARDRCTTSRCDQRYADCTAKLKAKVKECGFAGRCEKFTACLQAERDKCKDTDKGCGDRVMEKCGAPLNRACGAEASGWCLSGGMFSPAPTSP